MTLTGMNNELTGTPSPSEVQENLSSFFFGKNWFRAVLEMKSLSSCWL